MLSAIRLAGTRIPEYTSFYASSVKASSPRSGGHPVSGSTLWPSKLCVIAAISLGVVLSGISGLFAEGYPPPALPRATQAWSSLTGEQLLCVAGDQVWSPGTGVVKVLGVQNRGPKTWTIRDEDHLKTWKVLQQADLLRTEIEGQVTEYRRLRSVPEECGFAKVPIGEPREMPWEQRDAITREIHERMLKDDGMPGNSGPTSRTVIENREYLKKLIHEIGWIDLRRFGKEGSGNAIILAQHSGELPLMVAILPFVEKEYKGAGDDSVMYAILYDRLQLNLGRKQRYGTQVGKDSEGNPVVLPLENASKVEQFRKEIGLPPLTEYLKLASEGLYGGKSIRMPRADE